MPRPKIFKQLKVDCVPFVPRMRPWVRRRYVCFTLADWKAFGDALAEALPDAVYVRDLTAAEQIAAVQPGVYPERHLCDSREPDPDRPGELRFPGEIWMYLNSNLQLRLERTGNKLKRWSVGNNGHVWPLLRFLPSVQAFAADQRGPEHREDGEIQIYVEPGNKGQVRFASQVFRMLGHFATNRNQIRVRYPHYEVAEILDSGSWYWLGHDAVRWAREDPRRLLAYHLSAMSERTPDYLGGGYLPNDDGLTAAAVGSILGTCKGG